jgi:hypothetical protein
MELKVRLVAVVVLIVDLVLVPPHGAPGVVVLHRVVEELRLEQMVVEVHKANPVLNPVIVLLYQPPQHLQQLKILQ